MADFIGAECAHCGSIMVPSDPGTVRQWRVFVLPFPYEPRLACCAICEGAVRRESYAMAAAPMGTDPESPPVPSNVVPLKRH